MTRNKGKANAARRTQQQCLPKKASKKAKKRDHKAILAAQQQQPSVQQPSVQQPFQHSLPPEPNPIRQLTVEHAPVQQPGNGRRLLEILYGGDLPANPHQHGPKIVKRIVMELKNRLNVQGAITEGRTVDFMRYQFDLKFAGFRDRLLACFIDNHQLPGTMLKRVNEVLRKELSYVISWNPDAFPEIQTNQVLRKSFSLRFPGEYISVFVVLETDGVDTEMLDFSKPGQCSRIIFSAMLDRVQATTPYSPILYEPTTWYEGQTAIQLSRVEGEARRDLLATRIAEELNYSNCFTLALVPDNFQTGLVKIMQYAAAINAGNKQKIKDTVEGYMYRMALKEPKAFPEIFSSVRPRGGHRAVQQSTPPDDRQPFAPQREGGFDIKEEDSDDPEESVMSEADGLRFYD